MTKILIVAGLVLAGVAAGVILLAASLWAQTPEALLEKLAAGKGDQQDLIMRINMARGDVVGSLIRAFRSRHKPPEFRATVLELLFKRNARARDPKIEEVLLESLKDPSPIVRRKAAYGLAIYAGVELQLALADCVTDPDGQVRKQAYLVLGVKASYTNPGEGLWKRLVEAGRIEKLVQDCRQQAEKEQDEELRYLCRAVVGREIEIRAAKATQMLQTGNVAKAEEILRGALELDPDNRQAQIRLVRHLLKSGSREQALELAKRYGALIEIPRLTRAPVIDGDPTDEVWQKEAYKAGTFYLTTSRWIGRPTEGKSEAYVGHRDGKIYVAVLGYEDDLTKLIRKRTVRDGEVWYDDCVELVFDPDNTEEKYYQFVINSIGTLFDQARREPSRNFACQHKAGVFAERKYWACEFALEGKDLDNHPIEPGAIWSLNFFRTRIGAASEHGAMWPPFGHTMRVSHYPLALFK